ncbi:hypothetical protein LSTR_LSTR010829 [Laodelphax striatellus]|uniref:Cilia- and flagella-associated protein 91 n=1 Tax=Laodelphax striatellus TaxID=195883 RepID=A0A482WMD0_LAOST|nr:hypothetical protein LSTR_LSTR010829 [Laodelphax striatellus]
MTKAIAGGHKRVKLLPNRPLDFIYDPVFTVSNSKDYYATVSESMKHATEIVSEGLPAGIHEVELIERARIKRQWEQVLMNDLKTAKDIETREKCIIDMETSEWLFREQEIEKINSYRMELANKSMRGEKSNQFNRLDERVNRQIRRKEQQKNDQLKSLHDKKERELRKLTAKHKAWDNNLKSTHGTKESVDNLLTICSPLQPTEDKKPPAFSTDHEVIKYDKMMFGTVEGLILMENAPLDPAPAFNFIKASKPKTYGAMCHKLCRWSTDEDLKQLQTDLRRMSVNIGHKTHTLTKKEKVKPLLPPLLCIEIPIKQNIELYKATSFIQQLLRGRAVQYKVFQDRKRLQPLIEELKKTRSLYKEENEKISQKRYEALALMRKQFVHNQLGYSTYDVLVRDRWSNLTPTFGPL